jgi:hypothetical protein
MPIIGAIVATPMRWNTIGVNRNLENSMAHSVKATGGEM